MSNIKFDSMPTHAPVLKRQNGYYNQSINKSVIPEFKIMTHESISITGTSFSCLLYGMNYSKLCKLLGHPNFNCCEKSNFEWIIEFNRDIFIIYDWKTNDIEYSENKLTTWNVGSKQSTHLAKFMNLLYKYK